MILSLYAHVSVSLGGGMCVCVCVDGGTCVFVCVIYVYNVPCTVHSAVALLFAKFCILYEIIHSTSVADPVHFFGSGSADPVLKIRIRIRIRILLST